ncbi:hypothetical protein ACQJBY_058869 [Aegilops geniculata]
MEEGVADAATGGGMDGAVEGVADAAPVSASGGHGGEATGGHGGEAKGVHAEEAEGVPGAPLEGVHGGEAEGGPGAAPEGGHGGEAEGGPGATASDASAPAWLQGMDPNSTYLLKIKLLGNPKKSRKDIKCFCYDKVIDSDLTNYKDLVESIVEQYLPRYLEVAHVQYYDPFLKIYPEVTSDQELVSMFEKLSKTKVVHLFVAYCDPSEPYEPITEWHIDVHIQPSNTEQDDDDYLRNPIPENEHVGVDEENIYLDDDDYDKLDPLIMVPCSDKERDEDYVPDHESEDESEDESDEEVEEDEEVHEAEHAPHLEYDKLDPPMTEGTKYPNMAEFKLALSQHAIKHEFEFNTEKSAPHRFRAYCSRRDEDKCSWRIYASTMEDGCTVMVRKNSCGHDCSSTKRKKKIKNATKRWICEHVKDWLIEDATLGPKALRKKLKEHHGINIKYKRVYMGKLLAMKELYGDWDTSFDNLYSFKAQIERCCPGSIVIIEHHTIKDKIRFKRFFVALKPCIDGFLSGCRPYLAVDSTFLTGRFKGQLASATAVDGHSWMYPVCMGVFDSETNENWIWFMQLVRQAIGSPRGLTICTDAGQPVMTGVKEVFPEAEHRECMFHLVSNFKKKFHGKVFDDHLWAAAYSWNPYLFEKNWVAMDIAKPTATAYLRKWHTRLWSRSQFSTISKVDYVTNNLAECFNNWIKHHKSLNLDDFFDKLRQLIMIMWNRRRKVARKLVGLILPHIIKKLNAKTRELNLEVVESSEEVAEVTALGGSGFRFVVNLLDRTCSCRQWEVSGLPCKHGLAFITSLTNARIENYVDSCYSIHKFRAAYDQLIPAMVDKNQWPKSDHGFFMFPPLLKATAGRPKTERYKGCSEKKRKSGQHLCPICMDYGHHWHKCKKGNPDDIAAILAVRGPPKKRTKTTKSAQSSIVPCEDDAPSAMRFPPSQILEKTTKEKGKGGKSGSGGAKR